MQLNDTFIRKLKPSTKSKKYADGQGLFLFVNSNGTKSWRFRYRDISGKEKEMTFGTYPELSLSDAREKRLEQRKLVANGKDPISEKKTQINIARVEAGHTFEVVAREWHNLNKLKWCDSHAKTIWNRLQTHVFPVIGNINIANIDTMMVLEGVIFKLEQKNKTETSRMVFRYCSKIFRRAVVTKRIVSNPLYDMADALKPHKTVNLPTIDITALPKFLEKLEAANCHEIDKLAIKFLMLTFVRTGELRRARWEHIDLDVNLWKIPKQDMKGKKFEHWVPLSKQAVDTLHLIYKVSGNNEYVFPTKNIRKHPYMNENVINKIIHGLGYKGSLVGHGFRSLASTTLNELGYNSDVIERQLAHVESNKVRAAYNRAEYLPQRIELMQAWADHIDKVCSEAEQKKVHKIAA